MTKMSAKFMSLQMQMIIRFCQSVPNIKYYFSIIIQIPEELYENTDQYYDIDTSSDYVHALIFSSDYCSKTNSKLGQHHHVQMD